eukprot:scaffold5886_cov161-Amphora_coffeaeformis.AAC.8
MQKRSLGGIFRELETVAFGFLLYADRGGVEVSNVATLSAFGRSLLVETHPSCADVRNASTMYVWVLIVWPPWSCLRPLWIIKWAKAAAKQEASALLLFRS